MKHLAAPLLLCGVLLVACGGSEQATPTETTTSSANSTTTATPETTPTTTVPQGTTTTVAVATTITADPTWTGPVYPLTGLPALDGIPAEPALVVKVGNNSAESRPQYGLMSADIVYEVRIENEKTRFISVFHSRLPEMVMPVRSARSSDFDLMGNLNRPLFVYWGANDGVDGERRSAENRGIFDSRSASGSGNQYFSRFEGRPAPYNGMIEPEVILGSAPDSSNAPHAVFAYGELPASAVPALGVQWSTPNRDIAYVWDAGITQWLRYQDGYGHLDEVGAPLAVDNVLVLYISYRTSSADTASPQALTTGFGDGWLLRDGTVTGITWERNFAADPWTLTDDGTGQPVTLDPGTAWVAFAKIGQGSILGPQEVSALVD